MNLHKSELYFDIYQELSHVVRVKRLEQGYLQFQKKGHALCLQYVWKFKFYSYKAK